MAANDSVKTMDWHIFVHTRSILTILEAILGASMMLNAFIGSF